MSDTSPLAAFRHRRIQVRAYFAAEHDGFRADPVAYWIAAEAAQALDDAAALAATLDKRAKRSAAARKGAATRAANKAAKLAAEFPHLSHLVDAPAYVPGAIH